MIRVANLKTSRPFIFTKASGFSKCREPDPGSQRCSPPPPSAPSSNPRNPPWSTACITTAPAPSPKRTSVERSSQSRIFERTSPPTTRARLEKARGEHRVRLRERVDEAGAAREEVVGGGLRHPELVGEQRRGRREHHVGRHRRADEEVDVGRIHSGLRERRPSRGQGDVGQGLVLSGDAALADPGPLEDPLVGGVDDLASSAFVSTRSGTCVPSPVIPIRVPVVDADHVLIAPRRRSAFLVRRARRRRARSLGHGRSARGPCRSRRRARACLRARRRA